MHNRHPFHHTVNSLILIIKIPQLRNLILSWWLDVFAFTEKEIIWIVSEIIRSWDGCCFWEVALEEDYLSWFEGMFLLLIVSLKILWLTLMGMRGWVILGCVKRIWGIMILHTLIVVVRSIWRQRLSLKLGIIILLISILLVALLINLLWVYLHTITINNLLFIKTLLITS